MLKPSVFVQLCLLLNHIQIDLHQFLVKKLNGFQVSTGEMLRDEIKNNTEIGKKIINNMNEGKFVQDEIVNKLIKKVIFDPQKKNNGVNKLKRINKIGNVETTNSSHFSSIQKRIGKDSVYRLPIHPSLDGNTVEMAVEQMQFSENVMRYQTTLTFLNNKISGLRSAIKGE